MPHVRAQSYVKYRAVSTWVQTRRPAASDFRPNTQSYVEPLVTGWQSLSYYKTKHKVRTFTDAKIHNRVNNSLALEPTVKPVRIPTSYFNIIPPERPIDTNDIFPKGFLTDTPHSPSFGHYRVRTADRRSSMFRLQLHPAYYVLSGLNTLYNSWSQTHHHGLLTTQNNKQTNNWTRPSRPEEYVALYSLQNYFVISSLQLETGIVRFNPLTQGLIWIINTQSVPRSKHTPSQLYKPVS